MFFVSLMAPLILLLLFVLFLRTIYLDSFTNSLPSAFVFARQNVPDAFVGGWIVASLMSVSCITVSLGAGVVIVQDKISGAINDIKASPVKKTTIAFAYFLATFVSASIIVFSLLILGFIYLAFTGWFLSFVDVLLIILNTVLLTLFGCGLSTLINMFIKSEGGVTALSALSSSVYGFICGAYMPLAQFGSAFSNIFGFNPGLYSSIIFKNLFTRGAINKMSTLPIEAISGIKDAFDLHFYFFGKNISLISSWFIISGAVIALVCVIILISYRSTIIKNKQR